MNRLENWLCATSFWRFITQRKLLPWILSDADLGDHLLEIGAGAGAATDELRRHVPYVTSLEYDHRFAAGLAARQRNNHINRSAVLQGDAVQLPFADRTFSSAIAVLVLHHLQSSELQGRAFAEIFRVLKRGACLYAFEIQEGWPQRAIHTNSNFVPLQPASVPARLTAAGFSTVTIDFRRGGFRLRASRAC